MLTRVFFISFASSQKTDWNGAASLIDIQLSFFAFRWHSKTENISNWKTQSFCLKLSFSLFEFRHLLLFIRVVFIAAKCVIWICTTLAWQNQNVTKLTGQIVEMKSLNFLLSTWSTLVYDFYHAAWALLSLRALNLNKSICKNPESCFVGDAYATINEKVMQTILLLLSLCPTCWRRFLFRLESPKRDHGYKWINYSLKYLL